MRLLIQRDVFMKTNSVEFCNAEEKRLTLADVIANQHPVINGWIMFSAIAILALYAITFMTI